MATIEEGCARLAKLAQDMREDIERGNAARKETLILRDLLSSFGYQMKVENAVKAIENCLDEHGLKTNPDLHNAWSGGSITVERDVSEEEAGNTERIPFDPTIRITAINAAHRLPASVKPDATLQEAMTLMQMRGVQYLPVMSTERDIRGVITWRSIAEKLALGGEILRANQVMNTNYRIRLISEPLFEAMDPIVRNGFVLVRDDNNSFVGLITANDFAQQFAQLARPFLMVGEIEGYLRQLIRGKFSEDELREAQADAPEGRRIGPRDMTMGGYIRLVERPDNWEKLALQHVDRKNFIDRLHFVREKRNEIMHFSPEGLDPDDERDLATIVEYFRGMR